MSEVVKLVKESIIKDIAEAIKEKEGSVNKIPVTEMAQRIMALGGSGVEYTTGKLVMVNNFDPKTIQHGLSKAPKLFILKWDNIATVQSMSLNMALYTEQISSIWNGSAADIAVYGMYTSVPGVYASSYGVITADDTSVMISYVAKTWNAGDWTWEAWTW